MNPKEPRAGASPPTARVIRVLELFSARPDQPRNPTDVARDLGLARATCALILDELTAAGWLVQTARGYVLGPRLVPLGRAALASPAAGAIAHDELVALADDIELVCTTTAVIGEQIVVVDRAGPLHTNVDIEVGMQFAFAPPAGIVNVAWQSDATIDAWLRRSPRPISDEDRSRFWSVVADVRKHGFFIEQLSPQVFQLWALLAGLATEDVPDTLRRAIGDALVPLAGRGYHHDDLVAGRTYPVSIVVAPTFDTKGRQQFVIAAFVADDAVPYHRLMSVAERVRAAADRVTESAGGIDPWT